MNPGGEKIRLEVGTVGWRMKEDSGGQLGYVGDATWDCWTAHVMAHTRKKRLEETWDRKRPPAHIHGAKNTHYTHGTWKSQATFAVSSQRHGNERTNLSPTSSAPNRPECLQTLLGANSAAHSRYGPAILRILRWGLSMLPSFLSLRRV